MFPLLLHGGTAFQEAQLLWELQPQQSGSCSSLGDLGSVGCFWFFFPLKLFLKQILKCFHKYVTIISKCSCAVELGLLFKNGDCFLQVLLTGSRIKVTFAVV